MSVTVEKTVRELALENLAAPRVFEKLGIDYCCGGNKPLSEACRAANIPLDDVLDALEMAEHSTRNAQKERNWNDAPLADLIAHISTTHHQFTRQELARIPALLDKVCSVHGKNHPELTTIREIFRSLAEELTTHLMKEEMILFPHVMQMEEASIAKEPALPAPFGAVQNPISMMEHEHDDAGNALRAMRKASGGYSAPSEACVSYQALYHALLEFETDLHRHIHLENNILFPRAIAMENTQGPA
jgi:regulator of cell morphogenesis and NO signaling